MHFCTHRSRLVAVVAAVAAAAQHAAAMRPIHQQPRRQVRQRQMAQLRLQRLLRPQALQPRLAAVPVVALQDAAVLHQPPQQLPAHPRCPTMLRRQDEVAAAELP